MKKKLFIINLILIAMLAVYIGKRHFDNYVHQKEAEQLIEQYNQLTTAASSAPYSSDPIEQSKKLTSKGSNVKKPNNEIIGRIRIPAIKLDYPVLSSTTDRNMKIGITKFSGCEITSPAGNIILAGHNMRRKNILFSDLYRLKLGEEIILYDMSGSSSSYEISDIYIVAPDSSKPLTQDTLNQKWVTLITCTDMGRKRLIIHGIKK